MTDLGAIRERYRTIVADPPWRYKTSLPEFGDAHGKDRSVLPYASMDLSEICSLPVSDLAETAAHLYLWTTNAHLRDAFDVAEEWGFRPSTTLVWCKKPRGFAGFPTYSILTEFVLFCRRGTLASLSRVERNWFEWPRGVHSAKPEAFLDIVERVSPPPRVELFARRNRLGWDTWGNEALEHVDLWNPS